MAKFVSTNVKVRSVRQLKLESYTDLNLTFLSRLVGPIHSRPIAGIPRGSGRAVDIGISKADQLGRLGMSEVPNVTSNLLAAPNKSCPKTALNLKPKLSFVRRAITH
jgi:hypothetical protein